MLNVYLSGEIHTDWREEIIRLCKKEDLNIKFSFPNTNHDTSDNCGVEILGSEEKKFWKDSKGAKINSIRTKKILKTAMW
jgi:YtoQ family protein